MADVISIFEHYKELQARAQSQRYQIYQLVNGLMENHRTGLLPSNDTLDICLTE